MALSGLANTIATTNAAIVIIANAGNRPGVTPVKLPRPHITYECTPSCVAKKFSNDMADDVT